MDLLTSGTRHTLGALYYSGLMRVLDDYSVIPVATQVIEQNIVFGDASLMVRTAAPSLFQVQLPGAIDGLARNLTLAVGSTGSGTVAVTRSGELLGVADFAGPGPVDVLLARDISSLSQVTVTVTGFNMVPWEGAVAVLTGASPVRDNGLPARVALRGNYPNPFNPSTQIVFELPTAREVVLTVYDIRGREIRRLVSGHMEAGSHRITWQGTDRAGREVPSGVYLYRLTSGVGSLTGRMTLTK